MSAPILVALDVPTRREAVVLAEAIGPHVAGFKVGLELLMGEGPAVIGAIGELGKPVFADAKLHDIPNTVYHAARQLGSHGARWVTAHASGGATMLRAAVDGLSSGSQGRGAGILAVTVLTSLTERDFDRIGIEGTAEHQVARLAELSAECGVEGVVCAPQEIELVRASVPDLAVVVPGIRPDGVDRDDQARVATPVEAIEAGASLLVIGRAITRAPDPAEAASRIAATIVDRRPTGG